MVHLFGIRHHGPGSATAVVRALEAAAPDVLLIEAPADAEGLLRFVGPAEEGGEAGVLEPPVAALIYNPKDLGQAVYLPFAEFSPEWQAILFARRKGIPVRFMDLPVSVGFALDEKEKNTFQGKLNVEKEWTKEEKAFRKDPMGYLARLAGYTDSERWWEVMFENPANETDIFEAIGEMTTALREQTPEPPRNLQREAFMRQTIRKAKKEGFENVAVVCGAWHVPALSDLKKYKAGRDASLLRGTGKVKTVATWIPWSYDRMTFQSGYGAGVVSPAWYELLFFQKNKKGADGAATRWMINVARLLRTEDLDASSAHVIEAIRLAETLASLRGLSVPGIGELKEAAVATICEGSPERLALIEQKLIAGQKVGHVPPAVPVVPLMSDILKKIKSARMGKYWENTEEQWLKGVDKDGVPRGIVLREESDQLKSRLLHRLRLLGIHWGEPVQRDRHQTAGLLKEYWKMKWSPELTIRIIEMGAWGNTVEEACVNYLKKKTDETDALPALTRLVEQSLHAHLPAAFDDLLRKLENLAALTTDIYHLIDALPPLAQIAKYGSARGTDVATVEKVVAHLIPRICIGLPGAVARLDEEASQEAFKKMQSANRAIGLLNDPGFNRQWYGALEKIAAAEAINGYITGGCTRLLLDKKILTTEQVAVRMSYALSPTAAPSEAAQWLEGFLIGSGTVLLHNHPLWRLLDDWVAALDRESFTGVLAVLRRTFSKFSQPERQGMMALVRQAKATSQPDGPDYEKDRAAVVLPVVRALMGM